MRKKRFHIRLNFISYYKPWFVFGSEFKNDKDKKFLIKNLGQIAVFLFLFKRLHEHNCCNIVSFVILPSYRKYFTLVKGPKGHKSGKFTYMYSYYKFLIVFNKYFNTYLFHAFWHFPDLINFFNLLQNSYSLFTNNMCTLKKFKFSITNELLFI